MPSSSSPDLFTLQKKFGANELPTLLEAIREKYPNCEVILQNEILGRKRQRVIVFQQGEIAFCGNRTPKLEDFVELLRTKINPDWIDRIVESSQSNLNEQMTARQFCGRLLKMRVIQNGDLLKTLLSSFILAAEPFWASSGTLSVQPLPKQENYAEIEWRIFKAASDKRNQIWQGFKVLNHGINSIPVTTEDGFKALQESQDETAERDQVIQLIEQSIDGRSDIFDLAKKRKVDPISMAHRLVSGIEKGWLAISKEVNQSISKQRGNILVVDDNPTTRKLLVTTLQEFYDAHATSGGLGAVSLIPSKHIDLVLVSQSVPVATCLQLCKVIRQNPDYQNMPFLVISSNENFFERAKAKMVGVTDYLSQPVDRTKILYALNSYLK
jgi:CheY-like chemotaxis protein